MSAAQGWDRNRRRGGGAAGGASGGSGAGAAAGGRGTGQLNRFVQLSGRPHLPGLLFCGYEYLAYMYVCASCEYLVPEEVVNLYIGAENRIQVL
ncbi:hypothetical protein STEG23_019699, partial [Scotinomys teguina]